MTAHLERVGPAVTAEDFAPIGDGNHNGWLGFELTTVEPGLVEATMEVRAEHLNPAAGLHGGVSASFADSLCGYGVFTALPEGADGFTTTDLSAHYLGRASLGETVTGRARLVKGGRQIQVWDAAVDCGDRPVAVVRVTQLIRYPRS